jgi:hypothetical protein
MARPDRYSDSQRITVELRRYEHRVLLILLGLTGLLGLLLAALALV